MVVNLLLFVRYDCRCVIVAASLIGVAEPPLSVRNWTGEPTSQPDRQTDRAGRDTQPAAQKQTPSDPNNRLQHSYTQPVPRRAGAATTTQPVMAAVASSSLSDSSSLSASSSLADSLQRISVAEANVARACMQLAQLRPPSNTAGGVAQAADAARRNIHALQQQLQVRSPYGRCTALHSHCPFD